MPDPTPAPEAKVDVNAFKVRLNQLYLVYHRLDSRLGTSPETRDPETERLASLMDKIKPLITSFINALPDGFWPGNPSHSIQWETLSPGQQLELSQRLDNFLAELGVMESDLRRPNPDEQFQLKAYITLVPFVLILCFYLLAAKGALHPCKSSTPTHSAQPQQTTSSEAPPALTTDATQKGTNVTEGAQASVKNQDTTHQDPQTTDDKGVDGTDSNANWDASASKSMEFTWPILGAILCFGAFGGWMRAVASCGLFMGEEKLYRCWLFYYYMMPFQGMAYGLLICLLFAGGLFDVEVGNSGCNILFAYGLSAMAGLFAKNVSKKLQDMAVVLFGKPSEKDS